MAGPGWPVLKGLASSVSSAVMTFATLAVGSGVSSGLVSSTFRASIPTAASPCAGQARAGAAPDPTSEATTCSTRSGASGRAYAARSPIGISAAVEAARIEIFTASRPSGRPAFYKPWTRGPTRRADLPKQQAQYSECVPRPSPVTDAVRARILTDEQHAWSLDELLAAVRENIDTADFSTIFRAIGNLERSGMVDR